ncbi:MAG: SPOR domain-containing protein [Alphaproteobacteria bacterium]|jgi:hypothetical protein
MMDSRVVSGTFTRFLWISLGIGLLAAPGIASAPVFMLQFGSFETRSEAEAQAKAIATKHGGIVAKYPTSIREITMPPDNLKVYRTQSGPLTTRAAAQTVCAQLASQGDECYVVETMMASPPPSAPMSAPSVVSAVPPAAPEVKAALPPKLPLATPTPGGDVSAAPSASSATLTPPAPTHTSTPLTSPEPVTNVASGASPPAVDTPSTEELMNQAMDEAAGQTPKESDPANIPKTRIDASSSSLLATPGVDPTAPPPARPVEQDSVSLWAWLTGDDEEDNPKPKPAAAPVAAPVDAVVTTLPRAADNNAPATNGDALAALPPPSPASASDVVPAPVPATPQISPLAVASAPTQVKALPSFPPPPPPLPASANVPVNPVTTPIPLVSAPASAALPSPVLTTPGAPESTGTLSTGTLIVVPMSPSIQGTPGGVQVGEAQRVPLSDAEKILPAPMELPAPVVGVNEATDATNAPFVPPSSVAPQKTLWAQIQFFENQQEALAFWDAYRKSHPDFPAVRVRVTSPLSALQRGDDRVTLRVGPFAAQGFVRMLCKYVEATDEGLFDKNMECGSIVDLGASASAYAPRERTAQQVLTAARYAADHPGGMAATSYWVQLGSYASYRAAQEAWKMAKTKHNDVLGDTGFQIKTPSQGSAKSIFRLQTGPFSSQIAAREVCSRIKVNQGQCLVLVR